MVRQQPKTQTDPHSRCLLAGYLDDHNGRLIEHVAPNKVGSRMRALITVE